MRCTLVVSDAAYRPHLARALEALGLAHFQAERWGEAVSAFEEAVAVLRQFAEWEPDGTHDLAVALGLLAGSRARAGRDGDAAVSQEECVSILRAIVWAGARELRPWLAQDLDAPSYRMGCAERWTEVAAPLREAVDIRRELAEEDPDAPLPELADLLVTLASALLADGQHDEARSVVQEAIEILAPLGERAPNRYAAALDRAFELRDEMR
jgi:tetratricopeptide (TPR) repeat protein